jgi:hypothetical protein
MNVIIGELIALAEGIHELLPGQLFQGSTLSAWGELFYHLPHPFVLNLIEISDMPGPKEGYIHWPIVDGPLPDTSMAWSIARFLSELIDQGKQVVIHCLAGVNRSSLLAAMVMYVRKVGTGSEIMAQIRGINPEAFSNDTFAHFIENLR